jgi:HPt (histidine-containing phosphotransfer) domain-containing protein
VIARQRTAISAIVGIGHKTGIQDESLRFVPNGDEDLLRDLAEVFLEEYRKCLVAIHEGLETQEMAQVRRAAHTLKGSLGHFQSLLFQTRAPSSTGQFR